jgi:hypothetical protein
MGTNFYEYVEEPKIDEDGDECHRGQHIGKRSAAGAYCWDCGVTLCSSGIAGIHMGQGAWEGSCPRCGQEFKKDETLENSAVGRELGFNKHAPTRKTGVKSASSFTWAIVPEDLENISEIVDEYDHRYSKEDFEKVLSECPITYLESIGREFS